jgi:hypothetical protein
MNKRCMPKLEPIPATWRRKLRRQYRNEDDLLRQVAAYHEASHLVIGVLMRLTPTKVTIKRNGLCHGWCKFRDTYSAEMLRRLLREGDGERRAQLWSADKGGGSAVAQTNLGDEQSREAAKLVAFEGRIPALLT